jgi:hypothetical protein
MRTEKPNFNCVLAGTISKFENKPIIYRLDEVANFLFYIPEGDLRRVLGPDHASTASAGYHVACVLALEGRRNEALALLRAAVEHGRRPKPLCKSKRIPISNHCTVTRDSIHSWQALSRSRLWQPRTINKLSG